MPRKRESGPETREERNARQRAWAAAHKEQVLVNKRRYYESNLESIKESRRKIYQENKPAIRARIAAYEKKNHERMAQYRSEYCKSRLSASRTVLLLLLGDRCCRCGFEDRRALQVDHVNGGGTLDRRSGKSAMHMYERMAREVGGGSKDYQLLCANCNWIKRGENNEIPHFRKRLQ